MVAGRAVLVKVAVVSTVGMAMAAWEVGMEVAANTQGVGPGAGAAVAARVGSVMVA